VKELINRNVPFLVQFGKNDSVVEIPVASRIRNADAQAFIHSELRTLIFTLEME